MHIPHQQVRASPHNICRSFTLSVFLCKSTAEIFNNFPLLQGVILQIWQHKLLYDKGGEKSVYFQEIGRPEVKLF